MQLFRSVEIKLIELFREAAKKNHRRFIKFHFLFYKIVEYMDNYNEDGIANVIKQKKISKITEKIQ